MMLGWVTSLIMTASVVLHAPSITPDQLVSDRRQRSGPRRPPRHVHVTSSGAPDPAADGWTFS
jgi:hypothetical protein